MSAIRLTLLALVLLATVSPTSARGIPRDARPTATGGNLDVAGNASVRGTLTAATIESTSGGVRFPDGTVLTTAANGGSGSPVPAGTVVAYAGRLTSVPTGWLVCDGRPIGRTQYAVLFAALGTSWGSGDGATTFNLPDLSGRFLRGVDRDSNDAATSPARDLGRENRSASNAGGQTGNAVGSLQNDDVGPHSHHALYNQYFIMTAQPGSYLTTHHFAYNPGSNYDLAPTTASSDGAETRPENAAVVWIIKAN